MNKLFLINLLFGFFTLLVSCSQKDVAGTSSNTETGELAGTLVFEDGTGAKNVTVEIIDPEDTTRVPLLKRTTRVIDLAITDKDGKYSFPGLKFNTYNLNAYIVISGDTLGYFRSGIVFNEDTDLGTDTLVNPGKCSTTVLINGQPTEGVECYLPGASYGAITDKNGACVISNIPPGTYDVAYRLDDHITKTVSDVVITSNETTAVTDVTLVADPDKNPPKPSGLSAVYNVDSGIVFLSWSQVVVSDLAGYVIFRNDTSDIDPTRLTAGLVADSVYRDIMPHDVRDTVFQYRIKSQDDDLNQSGFAGFARVTVTPPNKPGNPIPENEAVDISLSLVLVWSKVIPSGVNRKISYNVYMDTTPDFTKAISMGQSHTHIAVSNLKDGSLYYWRVVAREGSRENSGPVWSFTTRENPDTNNTPFVKAPFPKNGATGQLAANLALSWTGGDPDHGDEVVYDVYLSDDRSSMDKRTTGLTNTSYAVPSLSNGTDYFWQVMASDGHVTKVGPVWTFRTLSVGSGNNRPNKPDSPSPIDAGSDLELNVALSWSGGDRDTGDAVTYTVYFGTNSNPAEVAASGISATTYSVGPLRDAATYYWKIAAYDGRATATGDVWSFTTRAAPDSNTAPHTPSRPIPADRAANQPLSLKLEWLGGDPDQGDTANYVVCFGTQNPPTPIHSLRHRASAWNTPILQASTRYFWQIISTDGYAITEGPVWSFVTKPPVIGNHEPNRPITVYPADGDTGVSVYTIVKWSGGDPDPDDAVTYEVKLGQTSTPEDVIATGHVDTNLALMELKYGTNYYWQVTSTDEKTSATGEVWAFKTMTAPNPNQAPNAPSKPSPNPDAAEISTNPLLIWIGGDPDSGDTIEYDVYADTNNPPTTKITTTSKESARLSSLMEGILYHWQIVARDQEGRTTAGPVWTFTTIPPDTSNAAPTKPTLTAPANGVVNQDTALNLSWDCEDQDGDTLTYDIMLDTNNPPVAVATTGKPGGNYKASGLIKGETYYWRVLADDGTKSTLGDVWSFTTTPPENHAPVLDQPNDTTIDEGQELTFTLSATDSDGHDLTFSAPVKPDGVSLTGNQFSWTPGYKQSGVHVVTFIVTDDGLPAPFTDAVSVTITVNDVTVSDLAAWWDFNDGSGSTLTDLSGNENHGTIHGATWVDGVNGKALSFDGVDDYVNIGDKVDLGSGDLTICALVKFDVITDVQYFISKWFDGIISNYRIGTSAGGHIVANFGTGGGNGFIATKSGPPDMQTGIWYFISIRWKDIFDTSIYNTEMGIFINGESNGSSRFFSPRSLDNNAPLTLGADYNQTVENFFQGEIDEILIYNRALSDSEIIKIIPTTAVTDIDGNTYGAVKIGTQTWMAENLKTTKLNDGSAIPLVNSDSVWDTTSTPAYCWYNDDEANKNIYGALYNYYTIKTAKLCPTGWHVPTDAEWTTLTDFLGGTSVAGNKLKEVGTIHWNAPNSEATDQVGFAALPGGQRYHARGVFSGMGRVGYWWTATDTPYYSPWDRYINNSDIVGAHTVVAQNGYSVRCIKDN